MGVDSSFLGDHCLPSALFQRGWSILVTNPFHHDVGAAELPGDRKDLSAVVDCGGGN
jgi:hypothetical protein